MYIVEKNGTTRAVRDENQLAAFLNNGWVEKSPVVDKGLESNPTEIVEEPKVSTMDAKEESKENTGDVVYTREEIEKLPFFSLKSLAKRFGIEVKGKKSAELKAELIARL